jgi:hypothetical protein
LLTAVWSGADPNQLGSITLIGTRTYPGQRWV